MDDAVWESANYLLIWCDSFFNSYSDTLKKINICILMDVSSWWFTNSLKKQQKYLSLGEAKIIVHFNLQKHIIHILVFVNTYFCGSIFGPLEISIIYGQIML